MVFWASPKLQAGQTSLSILNGAIKGKMKICLIASDKKIFNKKFFCAFWTILTQKCRIFLRLLWRKMWSDWYARVPSHSKIRQFARVSDSPGQYWCCLFYWSGLSNGSSFESSCSDFFMRSKVRLIEESRS